MSVIVEKTAEKTVLYPQRTEKIMEIGPELAAMIKEKSNNFRNIDIKWAKMLSREWLAGRYEFKEEPLKFDEFGFLHDGQHRIEAIILSGMTLRFKCVFGVAPQASEGFVKPRTNGDRLAHYGFTNVNNLAAAVRLVLCWMDGDICCKDRVSPAAVEQAVVDHPDVAEFVRIAVLHRKNRSCSVSVLAAIGYISCRLVGTKPTSVFEAFCEQIGSGVNLGEHSPTRLLRERIQSAKAAKSNLRASTSLALTIKSWNAHVLGTPVRQLRWSNEGARAEAFPAIV